MANNKTDRFDYECSGPSSGCRQHLRRAFCYGILDRGLLAEGLAADVVVFDPGKVDHVIVNGEPLFESGHRVGDPGQFHGRLLRRFLTHAQRGF
jgi:hypothetical protein